MTTTENTTATVQLFVSYFDRATAREWVDTENHTDTTEALADLIGTAKELGWKITPAVDEDGEIVYLLTGEDVRDGLATIN